MVRSQNGYVANDRSLTKWYSVPGTNVELRLRTDAAGAILAELARQFHRHVEPIRDPGCWSFAVRPIRGGTSLSNHSSGTAIDLNAPAHPLGKRHTFRPDQVQAIRRLLAACGGTVRWGGDYTSRADEMHFEVVSQNAAALAAGLARLRAL